MANSSPSKFTVLDLKHLVSKHLKSGLPPASAKDVMEFKESTFITLHHVGKHKFVVKTVAEHEGDMVKVYDRYDLEMIANREITRLYFMGLSPHLLPMLWSRETDDMFQFIPRAKSNLTPDQLLKIDPKKSSPDEWYAYAKQYCYNILEKNTVLCGYQFPDSILSGRMYQFAMPLVGPSLQDFLLEIMDAGVEPEKAASDLRLIIFQVFHTLASVRRIHKNFCHCDLHPGNIRINLVCLDPNEYMQYELGGKSWYITQNYPMVTIIDYGFATLDLPKWVETVPIIKNAPGYKRSYYEKGIDDSARFLLTLRNFLDNVTVNNQPNFRASQVRKFLAITDALTEESDRYFRDVDLYKKLMNDGYSRFGPFYGYSSEISSLVHTPERYLSGDYFQNLEKLPKGGQVVGHVPRKN